MLKKLLIGVVSGSLVLSSGMLSATTEAAPETAKGMHKEDKSHEKEMHKEDKIQGKKIHKDHEMKEKELDEHDKEKEKTAE